jgi:hypothetical protein
MAVGAANLPAANPLNDHRQVETRYTARKIPQLQVTVVPHFVEAIFLPVSITDYSQMGYDLILKTV